MKGPGFMLNGRGKVHPAYRAEDSLNVDSRGVWNFSLVRTSPEFELIMPIASLDAIFMRLNRGFEYSLLPQPPSLRVSYGCVLRWNRSWLHIHMLARVVCRCWLCCWRCRCWRWDRLLSRWLWCGCRLWCSWRCSCWLSWLLLSFALLGWLVLLRAHHDKRRIHQWVLVNWMSEVSWWHVVRLCIVYAYTMVWQPLWP